VSYNDATMKRILFPTDLSESADHAMKQAVELAVQLDAQLDVFHVVTLHAADPANLKQALNDYLTEIEEEVFADLSERSAPIQERGVTLELSIERGVSAADSIVDRARKIGADLVVMGTHGRTGVKKLLLGSVAEQVVRRAHCHVMTVGSDSAVAEGEKGFGSILVPIDFTDYSEKAIGVAKSLLGSGGKLILQHVVQAPIHPAFYAGGVTRMFEVDPELPSRIRAKLEALDSGASEIVVTEGDIAQEIVATAGSLEAEMIVMGTLGLTGLDHALLGSVTERVLRKADIPVLAVK